MQSRVPSNRIVLAGFVGLLILMGTLALDSARQIRNVSVTSAALRRTSRERDTLLDQMSTDTYRSATLASDYMLEQNERKAASQRAELVRLQFRVEDALDQYSVNAPHEEEKAIKALKQRAESYWKSLAPAIDWNHVVRRQQGEVFLRSAIIPRRDELVEFVKEISVLDERTLDVAEERIQVVQEGFRRRVTTISMLTLLLGGILATVVVQRVKRLGAEAESRFNEAFRAREDLKRLSDRLLTVQEEERRNLSRELHDDLGQTMSAMVIELGKLEAAPAGSQTSRDLLTWIRRLAEENVAKVRNMALLLRPAMLDELGLIPALRWQAKEVGRRTGLRVKMIADEINDDLPDATRTCIFRVVQEALNNCVKHAKAHEARVVMQRDREGLAISVQDDGIGLETGQATGLGLLGIKERVSSAGGRFHIESQPGCGTVLSAHFSLSTDQCKPEEETID